MLAANPANAVRAMKVATRSYTSNECGARDLILTTWNVLDRDLERTSSVINAFVETLTDEEKKQDLLGKWKGFEIEVILLKFPSMCKTHAIPPSKNASSPN